MTRMFSPPLQKKESLKNFALIHIRDRRREKSPIYPITLLISLMARFWLESVTESRNFLPFRTFKSCCISRYFHFILDDHKFIGTLSIDSKTDAQLLKFGWCFQYLMRFALSWIWAQFPSTQSKLAQLFPCNREMERPNPSVHPLPIARLALMNCCFWLDTFLFFLGAAKP